VQRQTRLRPPSSLAHKKREASAAYTKSAEGCAGSGRCTFPASRRTCAPTIALQRSSWRRRSSRRAGSSGRRGRAGGAPGQHRRLFTHGKATYGFDVARLLPNRRFGTCWTSYCRLECYKLGRVAGFVDPKNGLGDWGLRGVPIQGVRPGNAPAVRTFRSRMQIEPRLGCGAEAGLWAWNTGGSPLPPSKPRDIFLALR
jgi:hypothetical protein